MMNAAASMGTTASVSSMKSPRSESSSPIGACSDTGSCAIRWISATRSTGSPISAAISPGVASRPRSWCSWRCTRAILLIVSTMCTGIRMVRAWSAIARVMACRIHQVAYVENL